jgi:hypothetical protein
MRVLAQDADSAVMDPELPAAVGLAEHSHDDHSLSLGLAVKPLVESLCLARVEDDAA